MPESQDNLLTPEFMAKLERIELISRKIFVGRVKGERLSKRRGRSVEFADYKSYVPGDDIRFLDWNVFGRLDRLFLKLFLEEEDLHIYILLDASRSMDFGQPTKFRFGQQVAAAIAFVGLVHHDRVVAATFNNRIQAECGPVRGRQSFWRLADFLTGLQPEGPSALAAATRNFAARHSGKGVVVVISDFLDKAGYEQGLRFLLTRDYDLYVLHVMAPEEIEPALTGDLRLLDSEDGDVAEVTISAPLLKRYKQNVRAFRASLRRWCIARGISYVFATSDSSFEGMILTYLRKHGLVR